MEFFEDVHKYLKGIKQMDVIVTVVHNIFLFASI